MASGKSFKDTYDVSSTFTGGFKPPEEIMIVGVDVPLEEWNQDLWDEARLVWAKQNPLDPKDLIQTTSMGGSIPPVSVVKRHDMVLCVEGRRRILGARAANKLLIKDGALPEQLIELALFIDKAGDLEVSVRIGNSGRLDDPPWVDAKNAARLRARGKSDAQLMSIFHVAAMVTITNWFHYLDCIPEIQALVESRSLPFAIGIEVGKLGKGEKTKQTLAMACLQAVGANLKGEDGKANARAIVKAILDGTVTKVSDVLRDTPPPPPQVQAPPLPGTGPDLAPLLPTGRTSVSGPKTETGRKTQDKPPSQSVTPIVGQKKLAPAKAAQITAALEPSQDGEFEGFWDEPEMIAFKVMAVVTGRDPSAEGLKRWPNVYKSFKQFVPSPKHQETK